MEYIFQHIADEPFPPALNFAVKQEVLYFFNRGFFFHNFNTKNNLSENFKFWTNFWYVL